MESWRLDRAEHQLSHNFENKGNFGQKIKLGLIFGGGKYLPLFTTKTWFVFKLSNILN
jgi:hypothetical protein